MPKEMRISQTGKITPTPSFHASSKVRESSQVESSVKNRSLGSQVEGLDEDNWMGTPSKNQRQHIRIDNLQAETHAPASKDSTLTENVLQSQFRKMDASSTSKMPSEFIQDILKGLMNNHAVESNPFYSESCQQKLGQMLTNSNKLDRYMQELKNSKRLVDQSVAENYQVLIVLLEHLRKSDIEIKHGPKGLELNFNTNLINKQENQIDRLQQKVGEKDEQIKEIVEEYESVVRSFNDVIEKLLPQTQMMGQHSRAHQPD